MQVYDNDGEKFRKLSRAAHVPSAASAQNRCRRPRYDTGSAHFRLLSPCSISHVFLSCNCWAHSMGPQRSPLSRVVVVVVVVVVGVVVDIDAQAARDSTASDIW